MLVDCLYNIIELGIIMQEANYETKIPTKAVKIFILNLTLRVKSNSYR